MAELLRRYLNYKIDLQLLDGDGSDAGNDDSGGGSDDGAGNDGDSKDGKGDDGDGAGGDDSQTGKTFKQSDVDAIISKRLARERKAWEKEAADKAKKAAMTEADRLKTEKEEAERKAEAATQTANNRLIRAEVLAEAATMGLNAKAALKLVDMDSIEMDDDGNISGVDKALKAALKEFPFLKGESSAKPLGDNQGGGGGDSSGKADMNAFIRRKAGRQ